MRPALLTLLALLLPLPAAAIQIVPLTSDGAGYDHPTFTPDGSEIIFARGSSLCAMPSTGGSSSVLFTLSGARPEDPDVAPNGEIYFTRRQDWDVTLHIYKYNRATGAMTQVTNGVGGRSIDRWPAVSPSGQYLLFGSLGPNDYDAWRLDLTLGTGSAVRLTFHPLPVLCPGWNTTDDGSVVVQAYSGSRYELQTVPASGGALSPLLNPPMESEHGEYHPTAEWIVFDAAPSGTHNQEDIWVTKADGSTRIQLTTGDAWDLMPVWSPFGDRIVFQRGLGSGDLWEIRDLTFLGPVPAKQTTWGAVKQRFVPTGQ